MGTGDGGGGKVLAVGTVAGGGLAAFVTLIATAEGRAKMEAVATWLINVHGAHPWLVYTELALIGYIVVGFIVGEFLRGAYPPELGRPPRWAGGLMMLARAPRVFLRGLGKWVASRTEKFGFTFEDDDRPPEKMFSLPVPTAANPQVPREPGDPPKVALNLDGSTPETGTQP